MHWLAVLLKNREFDIPSGLVLEAKEYLLTHFAIDYEDYDIIIGYRADDSYFSFAQDFINGTISYRQLNNAMHLGQLGQQFVLKSRKAFERIEFIRSGLAERFEYGDFTITVGMSGVELAYETLEKSQILCERIKPKYTVSGEYLVAMKLMSDRKYKKRYI